MNQRLEQSEFDELSAYLDGELPPERGEVVERLLLGNAAWQQAMKELKSLDQALGAYSAPQAPVELPQRIIAAARRPRAARTVLRIAAWLAPLAAAAAIVLAVLLLPKGMSPSPTGGNQGLAQNNSQALSGMSEQDQLAVSNLDFFRDYEVLDNYDTLQAIDLVESQGT